MRRLGWIGAWSRRRGWAAAALLVLLTNAVLLARVAWNRSGEPAARLDLTERELALPGAWRDEENTGLALTLRFHGPEPWQEPGEAMASWLDREKLGELGFDVGVDPETPAAERHYRSPLPREVWLVLEVEGAAWRQWITRREEEVAEVRQRVARGEKGTDDLEAAERSLAADRVEATRLFAIDAGRDRDALRARYADLARHAVVPATVRLHWIDIEEEPEERPAHLTGSVEQVLVDRIHVPLRHRPAVESALAERERRSQERSQPQTRLPGAVTRAPQAAAEPTLPLYRAELAVGRLGEPWLTEVERFPPEPAER
ncbi:MAG TPA: DUF4824 family protein [Thermoanaerobaculia bacterium]|nr:DUF4824 family protein [Thermoanaerobaculia bacterium]